MLEAAMFLDMPSSHRGTSYFLLLSHIFLLHCCYYRSSTIDTLAKETVSQGLLGIMVWFCRFSLIPNSILHLNIEMMIIITP